MSKSEHPRPNVAYFLGNRGREVQDLLGQIVIQEMEIDRLEDELLDRKITLDGRRDSLAKLKMKWGDAPGEFVKEMTAAEAESGGDE